MIKRIIIFVTVLWSLPFFISCEKSNNLDMDDSGYEFHSSSEIEGSPGLGEEPGNGNTQYEPGSMTAGEWNDLDNWNFWLNLLQENEWHSMQEYWNFNTTNRYSVEIIDNNDKAVVDARVSLIGSNEEILWQSRTNNAGKAELFGKLFDDSENPHKIIVDYNGVQSNLSPIVMMPSDINTFQLSSSAPVPQKMNIYFVIDATGSMGDEIEYLKAELDDVISTIQTQFTDLEFLVGSSFYRDEGDSYLVESQPFTTDISSLLSFVSDHTAGGGGDFPEAVHTALESAVKEQWEESAISRLMFLILDAPPHYEQNVIESIHESIKIASEKGIRIIPVTASGIDKHTEFLMRFIAIVTNGTYTFITDDSGIGNDHLEPTVGQYDVELLNELIIRLISESCEFNF